MEMSGPWASTRRSMKIARICTYPPLSFSKSQHVNVMETAILICLLHPYSLVKRNACLYLKTRDKRPWGVLAPFSLASVELNSFQDLIHKGYFPFQKYAMN